jgi:hypothetical protein
MTKKQETREQKLIRWLVGLVSTGLNGVAGAAGGFVFAPNEINFDDGIHKLFGMFALCFVFSCIPYFQQSPLYEALYEPTKPRSDDK